MGQTTQPRLYLLDDAFLLSILGAQRLVAESVAVVGHDWRTDDERARVAALEAEARRRGIA